MVNGWTLTFHMFDYNLDHLGLGTVDDPAWTMPDRNISYLARALAACGGLWGNHGYEAAYPATYTDADGDQLDGRNRYTLRFGQDPPVDAFWSITMYDLPGFYLVANPISRYSIGGIISVMSVKAPGWKTPGRLRAVTRGVVPLRLCVTRRLTGCRCLPCLLASQTALTPSANPLG